MFFKRIKKLERIIESLVEQLHNRDCQISNAHNGFIDHCKELFTLIGKRLDKLESAEKNKSKKEAAK